MFCFGKKIGIFKIALPHDQIGYSSILSLGYILTRILPFERCDPQVLADLLLQHVVLSWVIWGPLVLSEVFCWEVSQAVIEKQQNRSWLLLSKWNMSIKLQLHLKSVTQIYPKSWLEVSQLRELSPDPIRRLFGGWLPSFDSSSIASSYKWK